MQKSKEVIYNPLIMRFLPYFRLYLTVPTTIVSESRPKRRGWTPTKSTFINPNKSPKKVNKDAFLLKVDLI
jgi:hypothetical protein